MLTYGPACILIRTGLSAKFSTTRSYDATPEERWVVTRHKSQILGGVIMTARFGMKMLWSRAWIFNSYQQEARPCSITWTRASALLFVRRIITFFIMLS